MTVTVTVNGIKVEATAKTLTIKEAKEAETLPFVEGIQALFEDEVTRDGEPATILDLLEVEGWALFGGRQRALMRASITSQG